MQYGPPNLSAIMVCVQALFLIVFVTLASGQEIPNDVQTAAPQPVFFDPPDLYKIYEGEFNSTKWYTTLQGAHHALITYADERVSIAGDFKENYDDNNGPNVTGYGFINISATFVGYNTINLTIYDKDDRTLGYGSLETSTLLSYEKLNRIFTYILTVFVIFNYINMGATLRMETLKQIVKKPVGPIVGLLSQYGFMPVISFGLAKLFFPDNPLLQLGMFINGASPGGGASNMWTLLLGGSLDLSIMMTFVSTVFAFGTVPLWVLTLGPQIIGEDSNFVIPYFNIVIIVLMLLIPIVIGLFLQFKVSKVAVFLEKYLLKPFAIFNLIFIFSFGVYTHLYIFTIFNYKILGASFLLPGLGYVCGMTMAFLTRRSLEEIIAIAIETGVQNANIAMIILKFTLDAPAGDLTVVIPSCVFLMTPLPLLVALILKKIYLRFKRSEKMEITTGAQSMPPKHTSEANRQDGVTLSDIVDNGLPTRAPAAGFDNPGAQLRDDVC